jgi:hypothetical protein
LRNAQHALKQAATRQPTTFSSTQTANSDAFFIQLQTATNTGSAFSNLSDYQTNGRRPESAITRHCHMRQHQHHHLTPRTGNTAARRHRGRIGQHRDKSPSWSHVSTLHRPKRKSFR